MWLLILLAVKIGDPADVPGRVTLEFPTEQACQASLKTMTYWLKFDSFKVTGACKRNENNTGNRHLDAQHKWGSDNTN